jgi:leucyl/phenylalanyl-tRNA---protein transferase
MRDDPPDAFPPVSEALREPDGLLCAGGDLSQPRLLEAYRRGIFPWFSHDQPIFWWSPDPRAVLFPGELRISRSLAKTLRNRGFETTVDRDFAEVMRLCADSELRPEGTWISPQMRVAYQELHAAGYAHSVEAWIDGRLAGGLYGVSLGRVFFGESMFSLERDASKVALKRLVDEALDGGIELIDCQVSSPHLASLGARDLPRSEFVTLLEKLIPDVRSAVDWTRR